jgi:hypothetical protein
MEIAWGLSSACSRSLLEAGQDEKSDPILGIGLVEADGRRGAT